MEAGVLRELEEIQLPDGRTWLDFWDPDPGCAHLKFLYSGVFLTADESRHRKLIDTHKRHWWRGDEPRRNEVNKLHPYLGALCDLREKGDESAVEAKIRAIVEA